MLELKMIRERTPAPDRALSDGLERTARYAETNDAAETRLIICDERTERGGDSEIKVWGV